MLIWRQYFVKWPINNMVCNVLAEAFANTALTEANADPCLAAVVTDISPNAECEHASVSAHSPGRVENDETVLRMIFSPHMISKETGKVTEAAFSDVKNRGMSVLRGGLISDEQISEQAALKIAADRSRGKTTTEYQGFVVAATKEIRCIDDQERAFGVYDSAKPQNVPHADVVQIIRGSDTRLKRMRRELQKKFNDTPAMNRDQE